MTIMRTSVAWLLSLLVFLPMEPVSAQDLEQRRREAGHPATEVARLQELATDPSWEVRQIVGRNRKSSPGLLHQLAADPHSQVRIAVATNLSTREATFILLAGDPDVSVRSVVSRFEYVPASVLAVLAKDRNGEIRLEVARNWNTSKETLQQLSRDPLPQVSQMAELNLVKRREESSGF